MYQMTEAVARYLALEDWHYRARDFGDYWVVWCDASEHYVEYDRATIEAVARKVATTIKKRFHVEITASNEQDMLNMVGQLTEVACDISNSTEDEHASIVIWDDWSDQV